MENEKIQQNVYLCKKCLEKGEYFILLENLSMII